MEERTQLIPSAKLIELLRLIDKEEKIDKEAISTLSQFTEKYINDIITRTAAITKHKGKNTISEEEIKFVLEKEFDYFIAHEG
ncbi:transcription initiation factor TFIID subunit 12 [Nematocida sp. AWRm80]|nr:transcription initiation factor TFIID subunit 12 [Nematocida sp. AWRm80]